MGTMSTHTPQRGACPPGDMVRPALMREDMPSLRSQGRAYGHYVHAHTPALGMSPRGLGAHRGHVPLGAGPRSCPRALLPLHGGR